MKKKIWKWVCYLIMIVGIACFVWAVRTNYYDRIKWDKMDREYDSSVRDRLLYEKQLDSMRARFR